MFFKSHSWIWEKRILTICRSSLQVRKLCWCRPLLIKPEQSADHSSAAHAAHTVIKTDTNTGGKYRWKYRYKYRYKYSYRWMSQQSADNLSAGQDAHTVIKHWELCLYRKMIVWCKYNRSKLHIRRPKIIAHATYTLCITLYYTVYYTVKDLHWRFKFWDSEWLY